MTTLLKPCDLSTAIFDADALAKYIDQRIEEKIAAKLAEPLSTKNPGPIGRRAFNEKCRALHAAGDRRVQKFGRFWRADRSIFEPARDEKPVAAESWDPSKIVALGPRGGRAA